MTETEFNALAAQGYNRIPVTLETFADLDTPLSIYLKLANAPYTYLLESVQGGERFGRYSIIGLAAPTRIVVNGHQVLVLTGNRIAEREDDTNPLDFIGKFMKRFRAAPAIRPAAFLRRSGRLFRLRHHALCRNQTDAHQQAGRDRHAGHRPAALRRNRRRR
jgi:anthranilate synthase component 1